MFNSKFINSVILLVILFITSNHLLAQKHGGTQKDIDSLNAIVASTKNDSIKITSILQIADIYRLSDVKKCSVTIARGYNLAQEKDFKFGIARAKFLFGLYELAKGNLKEANGLYEEALAIFNEIKDTAAAVKVKYNIGVVSVYKGEYVKANETFFSVLKIYEALKNEVSMSDCYTAIANTFGRMGNSKLELDYHTKALKIKEKYGDKYGITACYINIGNVYGRKSEYDTALVYYFKGLQLAEEIQNQKWILNTLGNIGTVYTQQGKTKEGLEYLLKCYKMAEDIGDKYAITSTLNTIGANYISINDYAKGKEYTERALKLATEIGSKLEMRQSYDNLANAYSKMGDYKQAFYYHTLYSNIKDSLLNEETTKQLTEMQAKYDNEKQQKEIELLNKDKEIQAANIDKQQTIIWLTVSGLVMVLLLTFFVFKQYRQKQKANTKLQDAYNEIEEKNKEITDSIKYAKRIQQTLLPTEKYIEKHLKK
jgi:tetratricopeptide (TPR) repeat protein